MSESVKPRFAVDLNEIERHLAPTGSPQAQPAAAPRNSDPLAELARIVGQDDPFQAILANDGAARPRRQASTIDDLFATRDNVTPAPPQARPQTGAHARQTEYDAPDYETRGYAPQAEAPRAAGHGHAYHGHGYQQPGYQDPVYQEPAAVQQQASYHEPAYADEYYDDGSDDYDGAHSAQPQRLNYPPVQKPRSRKGLVAMGAIAVAVVVGGAGALMYTGSPTGAGGEPILVQATNEPVKVQPQNPGGVEIPNQNKQIYERTQQTETKVVNREEQPIDVNQAVRAAGGSSLADATGATVPGAPAQARSASSSLNLGEPRKVRTVTIRPDGTVVGAPEAAPSPSPASVPAMTMPAAASATPAPQAAPAQPQAVAATPSTTPAAPVEPAPAPAPQKVASVQPVAPVAASDTSVGGFAAQLGVAGSESSANATFAQLQRKYPDLEGLPSIIRKAEVNGNTIYRVRVGPMSREEASALCSKVQGQGGQCFVAKN